jgi:hypothetical protein
MTYSKGTYRLTMEQGKNVARNLYQGGEGDFGGELTEVMEGEEEEEGEETDEEGRTGGDKR